MSAAALAAASASPARQRLTWVELVWVERRVERWIRFGRIAEERIVDRRTRFVAFAPGAVFGFVRWAAGSSGRTAVSRLDILRVTARGEVCESLPGVFPGGEILLRLSGWPVVERALKVVDEVEALGVDPADAAPDYWRHVANSLGVGDAARAYSRDRRQAWILRRDLGA